MDIRKNIEIFIEGEGKNKGRKPSERYASFDYCFNYFQSFRENGILSELCSKENIEVSCVQLAFYLASWGMFRGSSYLLEKSSKFFVPLITLIASIDARVWEIDVPDYKNAQDRRLLLDCKKDIRNALKTDRNRTDTQITKIMLGVFGNVPAFDAYFKKGLSVNGFTESALLRIYDFYEKNQFIIDGYSKKIRTIRFLTGQKTDRLYTKAKLIDMIGFIEGQS